MVRLRWNRIERHHHQCDLHQPARLERGYDRDRWNAHAAYRSAASHQPIADAARTMRRTLCFILTMTTGCTSGSKPLDTIAETGTPFDDGYPRGGNIMVIFMDDQLIAAR